MPAAPPGVLFIATIPNPAQPDQTLITIEMDYNSANGNLTGASATNNAGRQLRVVVAQGGTELRNLKIPAGTTSVTKAQLNAAGFTTAADCVGLTFDLA